MKLRMLLILSILSTSGFAAFYGDIAAGALRKELRGDHHSYKGQNAFTSQVSLGYKWDSFDLSIETSYSIGRQKEFSSTFPPSVSQTDDFNWQSLNIGPTVKYHIKSSEDWSYAPLIGLFYNSTDLSNSAHFINPNTGEHEDYDQDIWGYGAKLGFQLTNYRHQSSWLEAISYNLFVSYTKYRETEADYLDGTTLKSYSSDTPDALDDISIGLTIGMSFGDKVFQKAKRAIAKIARF